VASSYRDTPIADDLVAIGEVGLTGEVRAVNHLSQRLQEVSRLGFKQCVIPRYGSDKVEIPEGLEVFRVRNIREAIEFAL
jgi:DNA repair protein RadA/Sms